MRFGIHRHPFNTCVGWLMSSSHHERTRAVVESEPSLWPRASCCGGTHPILPRTGETAIVSTLGSPRQFSTRLSHGPEPCELDRRCLPPRRSAILGDKRLRMKEGKTPITANVVAAIHLPPPNSVAAANGDDMGSVMVFLKDGRCYDILDVGKHLLGESQWQEGFTVPGTPAWVREQGLSKDSDVADSNWGQ